MLELLETHTYDQNCRGQTEALPSSPPLLIGRKPLPMMIVATSKYVSGTSLLLVAASLFADDVATTPQRPNVLFIAVDDLRPSIGCYGDEQAITPNIDRLASRGVTFDRAYCQVAVCNPSRASLMTGLRPDTLGVWTLPIHFREAIPDAVTMPQWFRRFGYRAVSHGKIFHNPTPDPQSWSEPIRKLPPLPPQYPDGTQERIRDAQAKLPKDDWRKNNLRGPATGAPDRSDEELLDGARTNLAIEDLRRLGRGDEPFFLAMGYIRPHLAWIAPKRYWDLHDPAALPVLTDSQVTPNTPPYALSNSYELTHYVDLIDFPSRGTRNASPKTVRSISCTPTTLARLISMLKSAGCWTCSQRKDWRKTPSSCCGATTAGNSANSTAGAK